MQQFQPAWVNTVNVNVVPAGSNDPTAPGVEASLDIEFLLGVSPNITTTFYASADFDFWSALSTWASLVASQASPPLVNSVSYGDQDPTSKGGTAYEQRVSQEFQKIGARGVSLIFASGDSGAGCNLCIFDEPSFPATSTWVTSVGATRFIHGQLNGPEMAVNEFGSGGGFSWTFAQPSYQSAAVNNYLTNYKSDLPWWFEFNDKGRATPDVAALGIGFQVVNGGATISVGGTSASAPTFAAIVTLLNSKRLQNGGRPLGFLNPWLYSTWTKDPSTFFDVVDGNNYDSCCIGGFAAAPGWDATTGLGTPNFKQLVKYI
jgi:tripeptidyl-peptidase-1